MAINREQFAEQLAQKVNIPQAQAYSLLCTVIKLLAENLVNQETIGFVGFGTLGIKQRAARQGRHPRTGKPLAIPAQSIAYFRPGSTLKQVIREAGAKHKKPAKKTAKK